MKRIVLRELALRNFKGIKDFKVNFGNVTNLKGDNGTGKTTVFDAFTYLLFDKDSQDRKDFEIKTLDSDNKVLHGLDHEVSAVIEIDGIDKKFSKIYKEKWTKKRGEAEKQLTGHTTDYYIDDVPTKRSEFQNAIGSIIDEKLFKLITNPLYFSTNLKWQDRREVLLSIIGDVDVQRVINNNRNIKGFDAILGDKSVDEFKKLVAAKKKKLNEDIKSIPFRIDELNNSIKEIDFPELEGELVLREHQLKDLEDKLYDSSKINEIALEKQTNLFKLKSKLKDLEYNAKSNAELPKRELEKELQDISFKIMKDENSKDSLVREIQYLKNEEEKINIRISALRDKWHEENLKTLIFDENQFTCPTCKRDLEQNDIDEKKAIMIENFNINKANALKKINDEGSSKKSKLEKVKSDISINENKLNDINSIISELIIIQKNLNENIENFKPSINLSEEYNMLKYEISELELNLNDTSSNDIIKDLRSEKYSLLKDIDLIKSQLAYREVNERNRERISELLDEEKTLANKIAEIEHQEFQCESFIKTKVELMENSINNKFKYVSFKLFNNLVNGAIEECCVATVNGVPYENVNSAGKINAGIDIINTLCEHYQIEAPVFIDNRESVNNLLSCKSQTVSLIVSKDKTLNVEVI